MKRKLPPLQTLQAFNEAAERLSFTKAAEALALTQSAISQQIRLLEEQLGTQLFERATRKLILTESGRTLHRGVSRALMSLGDAVDQIERQRQRAPLLVSVLPSFGSRWLVPRLHRFLSAHPNIRVTVMPSSDLVDFRTDRVDIAIRWTEQSWPDLACDELMRDILFPVCSPQLLHTAGIENKSELVARGPLIADTTHDDWRGWFAHIGEDFPPDPVARYDNFSDLIQGAISGQGVALARSPLVIDDLAAGRLVRLSKRSLVSPRRYLLLCSKTRRADLAIVAFRNWIMGEVEDGGSDPASSESEPRMDKPS